MEISLGLIGTIIGSATFGAIAGKLLDAFLLSKINDDIQRHKWLRKAKLVEFSKLSKEFSSLGFDNNSFDDLHKLNSIVSGAILLIDDKVLVKRVQLFVHNLVEFTTSKYPEIMRGKNITEIELPSGDKAGEKELAVGLRIRELENEALTIIAELNSNLQNT